MGSKEGEQGVCMYQNLFIVDGYDTFLLQCDIDIL